MPAFFGLSPPAKWFRLSSIRKTFSDLDKGNWSQQKIKDLYHALPGGTRREFRVEYSICSDPTLQAVRCAGVSGERKNVPPRMHHKFYVFCEPRPRDIYGEEASIIAHSVWTGSFNATENGARSLENAMIIRDESVAAAYYSEWKTILGISEPLDWKSVYVDPEWRIGT